MAGDGLEPMPMSPQQSAAGIVAAVILWLKGRRGRVIAMTVVFMLVFAGFTGMRHSESISEKYHSLSSISTTYHLPSWRPHLPNLPSIIGSPLRPSNITLDLENGDLKHPPSQLNKKTANFHLLMPSLRDDDDFCKTTLSAMLLNYPPPTVINLFQTFSSQVEREKTRLKSILEYLNNKKLVNGEDLLLIVDGHDTWFQLPSDVMVRQYKGLIADANRRLTDQYGFNADNEQNFKQTILFGAEKTCEGEDLACRYAAESTLPENIYGKETGNEIALTRAKYLDAGMAMGPAKDLKKLYEAAVKNFDAENSQAGTAQSVLATMFGEQEMARLSARKPAAPASTKWLDWFIDGTIGRSKSSPKGDEVVANTTLPGDRQYEFSMGLDYTHTLFQPFVYAAEDELVPLPHDNSTDLTVYQRPDTPSPTLHKIPTALQQARPPFWTPELKKDVSPNNKPSFIEPLAIKKELDELEARDTTWAEINLIQNTFTGAIPAALHLNLPPQTLKSKDKRDARLPDVRGHAAPRANLTWTDLWHAPYSRALLRKYIRTPQSPIGYHNAAAGGDRMWDSRGGRGGVWTEKDNIWLPWGEVDGVCGTLAQLTTVFNDDRGVWLHESEGGAEQERLKLEKELKAHIEEERKKAEEKEKEEKKKAEEEKEKNKQKEAAAEQTKKKEKEEKESLGKTINTGAKGGNEEEERRRRRWMA